MCLLTTLLFGQSSDRPQSIVIPISSIGEVSETRQQILHNTLTQELSKHFQILPQDQFERVLEKVFEELEYEECNEDQCIVRIQEILQIENVFNLQVIGEEGDTQLNLKWMNLDEKKNREDYCEGCKTKELRKRVVSLVNLILGIDSGKKDVSKIINNESKKERRYFWKSPTGLKYDKTQTERSLGYFEGEFENNLPNGLGTLNYFDKRYNIQIGTFLDGELWEGKIINRNTGKVNLEYFNGKIWNKNIRDVYISKPVLKVMGNYDDLEFEKKIIPLSVRKKIESFISDKGLIIVSVRSEDWEYGINNYDKNFYEILTNEENKKLNNDYKFWNDQPGKLNSGIYGTLYKVSEKHPIIYYKILIFPNEGFHLSIKTFYGGKYYVFIEGFYWNKWEDIFQDHLTKYFSFMCTRTFCDLVKN